MATKQSELDLACLACQGSMPGALKAPVPRVAGAQTDEDGDFTGDFMGIY